MRALLFLFLPSVCFAQSIASGVVMQGVSLNGNAVSFSPAAGTYTGAQSVSISCPSGTTAYYTTDGSTPNIASTAYSGPISVAASSTITAVCAQVVKSYVNVQASSSGWKCVTASGSPSPCQAGGGVTGTISAESQTYGSSMVESASTTASTGENQILWVNTQTGAGGTATMLAEDKIIQPSQGSTYIANNELDMNLNDSTQSPARYHAGGLQCNQQAGSLQWQIDNQQGSWQNTGITFGCPLSTTQPTEVRYSMHWTNGDTGCGGYGCDSYDQLTICTGGTCHTYSLGQTLEAYTETWGDIMIIQDQVDLTNTVTSGANPTTATRTITKDNLSAGVYSTMVTGSAAYTIH